MAFCIERKNNGQENCLVIVAASKAIARSDQIKSINNMKHESVDPNLQNGMGGKRFLKFYQGTIHTPSPTTMHTRMAGIWILANREISRELA
ncbi:MAG: hypothetical protein ACI87E_000926 [Mariniblastus sp.]|jgi:hypothetical protein